MHYDYDEYFKKMLKKYVDINLLGSTEKIITHDVYNNRW